MKFNKIEIAENDHPIKLDWDEAKRIASESIDGWRLPTKEELHKMHEIQGNGFKRFSEGGYWSSNEDGEYSAFYLDFGLGYLGGANRNYEMNVRLVRSI